MKKMMAIDEFSEMIKKELERRFCNNRIVTLKEMTKNNGVKHRGICAFAEGESVTPTVYLEEYLKEYVNGTDLARIVDHIVELIEKNEMKEFAIREFTDWELAKERICFRLINTEMNRKMLECVPSFQYLDLSVVFYYKLGMDSGMGNASILISNVHLDAWGVSKEDVYEVAKNNTARLNPPVITSIKSVLRSIFNEEIEEGTDINADEIDKILDTDTYDEIPMFVLSNSEKYYGASAMLYQNVIRVFADRCRSNLFILPSSVHELILLKAEDGRQEDYLRNMVVEVNATALKTEDVLSNQVYIYDRISDCISIIENKNEISNVSDNSEM